jgi:isopentenyl phosphate kinase
MTMIFLKLGGSLITEKDQTQTIRYLILERTAMEIARAWKKKPDLRILIGHGSGSFGHVAAARYSTNLGASTSAEWLGFAEVWAAAQRLNRFVVDAFLNEKLPALAFPPSASVISAAGEIQEMAHQPIMQAIEARLLPIVYGDVAFDHEQGAAIVSTENVFAYLARHLQPSRVLIAGIEAGVYANFPKSRKILPSIKAEDLDKIDMEMTQATDVTGGMRGKVEAALAIASLSPQIEVRIFSGEEPGSIEDALLGAKPGTLVKST